MHHVFISYSRRDLDWVQNLRSVLREQGVPTWLDVRDIPLSVPWLEEVTEAIEDAALFLVCASPFQKSSEPCAAENAVADRLGKERLTVDVGSKAGATAMTVLDRLNGVPAGSYPLRELHAQARGWDTAGRPSRMLASKAQRLSGKRCAKNGNLVDRVYLATSARRANQQLSWLLTTTVLTVVLGLLGVLTFSLRSTVDKNNQEQAATYGAVVNAKNEISADPYRGLTIASTMGDNESAVQSSLLDAVLSTPVPDDAFTLPLRAEGFASTPVGDEVLVRDVQHRLWSRVATATGKRTGDAHGDITSTSRASTPYGISLEDTGVVVVTLQGEVHRRIPVPGARAVFAMSPDSRWLAVSGAQEVSVVELETGAVRRRMVGAPDTIGDLAWSSDGTRLWAAAGTEVISWRWTTGTLLVNEPASWFQAILPSTSFDQAWLVERMGDLRLVLLGDGRTVRTLKVADTVFAAGGNGTTAVLLGVDGNWLVRLSDGGVQPFTLPPECSRPAGNLSTDDDVVLIPCGGEDVLAISLRDGRTIRTTRAPGSRAQTATITQQGAIVIGGDDGDVYWAEMGSDTANRVLENPCGIRMNAVLVSPRGDGIAPIGAGAAQIGCARVARMVGGSWEWNTTMLTALGANSGPSISLDVLSGAYSPSGNGFAVGHADGSLVMQPSDNLSNTWAVRDVAGGVRSMMFAGDVLYVATRSGVLQAIPWCDSCFSNAARARLAATIAERCATLGLGHE